MSYSDLSKKHFAGFKDKISGACGRTQTSPITLVLLLCDMNWSKFLVTEENAVQRYW